MNRELTAEEQRQANADMSLAFQLAKDEKELQDRADLQKRAGEVAAEIAKARIERELEAVEAKVASSEAATQQLADEAHDEAEGAPLTPGDDAAKAAAAGEAAMAEAEAEADEADAKDEADKAEADKAKSKSKSK